MKKVIIIPIAFIIISIILITSINSEGDTMSTDPTPSGEKIYTSSCALCHGKDGRLGLNGSKALPESDLDLDERIAIITHGQGTMNAFNTLLTDEEIEAVAKYTMTLK